MADGGMAVATLLHIVVHAGHCHPLGSAPVGLGESQCGGAHRGCSRIAGFHLNLNTSWWLDSHSILKTLVTQCCHCSLVKFWGYAADPYHPSPNIKPIRSHPTNAIAVSLLLRMKHGKTMKALSFYFRVFLRMLLVGMKKALPGGAGGFRIGRSS